MKNDVRNRAILILESLKNEKSAEVLIKGLLQDDFNIIIQALSTIGPPAVKPLICALKDSKLKVREFAAEALGKIGDAWAVEPLISVLQDTNVWVRREEVDALGGIGDARAIEPLNLLIQDSDIFDRYSIIKAIKAIKTRVGKSGIYP
jgi:HEAT repeat protein